jgi:hypothetical protein
MSGSGRAPSEWEQSLYKSLSVFGAEVKRVWSDLTIPPPSGSSSVSFVPYNPSSSQQSSPNIQSPETNPPPPVNDTPDPLALPHSPSDGSEDNPSPSPKVSRLELRKKIFQECIEGPVIKLPEIQTLTFQGIPEVKGLRSVYWKLLLNYLPLEVSKWPQVLEEKRELYHQHREEFVTPLAQIREKKAEVNHDDPLGALTFDDPLADAKDPHAKDLDLYREIEKDILRTHSMLHFFSKSTEASGSSPPTPTVLSPQASSSENPVSLVAEAPVEKRHQVLLRIMFVYAKLHPDIRYVQGMNEILAPLYFVFAQDPDPDFAANSEADCFFCFSNLMAEIKDRFLNQLDNVSSGSFSNVDEMMYFLRQCDPELCEHLDRNGVDPRFYAFRWLTLLLSQEFPLPDVLRIWDSLFADPDRFQFLTFLCCSMLV